MAEFHYQLSSKAEEPTTLTLLDQLVQEREEGNSELSPEEPGIGGLLTNIPVHVGPGDQFGYLNRDFQFLEGLDVDHVYSSALRENAEKQFACFDCCECHSHCP